MDELKTINEIFEENLKEFPDCRRTFEFSNKLKKEAINWIKYYEEQGKVSALEIMGKQKKSFEKEGKQYFDSEEEMWMTAKIISFITFFNLTAEELKEIKSQEQIDYENGEVEDYR